MVRVPVLSEQMTEVQPRVSTEGRDLNGDFLNRKFVFFLKLRLEHRRNCGVFSVDSLQEFSTYARSTMSSLLKYIEREQS